MPNFSGGARQVHLEYFDDLPGMDQFAERRRLNV